jgi:hypothetical protein
MLENIPLDLWPDILECQSFDEWFRQELYLVSHKIKRILFLLANKMMYARQVKDTHKRYIDEFCSNDKRISAVLRCKTERDNKRAFEYAKSIGLYADFWPDCKHRRDIISPHLERYYRAGYQRKCNRSCEKCKSSNTEYKQWRAYVAIYDEFITSSSLLCFNCGHFEYSKDKRIPIDDGYRNGYKYVVYLEKIKQIKMY